MQTNNVTSRLGLNQWMPGDKLNTGQFSEDNALVDTAVTQLDATIERIFGLLVPTGTILPFGGQPDVNKDPPGFLFLTPGGREVSRTTYAALFAVLGTTYGSGNGSTTFKLPDLSDRVPLGYSANLSIIGQTVGEGAVALNSDNNGPHTHSVRADGSAMKWNVAATGSGNPSVGNSLSTNGATNISAWTSGLGIAHNNMQPSLVVAYIIKI